MWEYLKKAWDWCFNEVKEYMDNDGIVCWLNLWILICINRTTNGGVYMWGESMWEGISVIMVLKLLV